MTAGRRENRGRNAAAENRRALVTAAAEVFGEQGIDAPLSAVAKRAGVGQGSLYRHFPDRVGLAVTAFEDNLVELEELAARPDVTLEQLLGRITEQTIRSIAFVDLVSGAMVDPRIAAVSTRVGALLADPLRRAQDAGRVRDTVRTADVQLAIGMVAAVVAKAPPGLRESTAEQAWRLLDHALLAS